MADVRLDGWRYSSDMWRMSEKLQIRYVDWLLRATGGHRIPVPLLARIYHLGIPDEIVYSTLKAIRGLENWSSAWVETAQHYLGITRREVSAGNTLEAEKSRYLAGACYHVAQIMELNDIKTRDSCRAWAASLAKRALPVVNPNARHFLIPWNDRKLPVLFEVPEYGDGPFGLVVMLNGVSQSKEETFQWAPHFLEAGYAVMSVDSPGTGEATNLGPIDPRATDILDGVFAMLSGEPAIDLHRVALVGASLGGNEAIRITRHHPDIMAVVAITPAVEPARWLRHASTLLQAELRNLNTVGEDDEIAAEYDALMPAKSTHQPMLIFGAGRDMVVPPNESQILAEALGDRATYVWYPDLGHCLYAAADQWTWEAATWIAGVGEARRSGVTDATQLAELGRIAIEEGEFVSSQQSDLEDDDDFTEYARLIPSSDED